MDTPLLAQDRCAEPPAYRAADFGGRNGSLVISEGLASDHYSLVPARSVIVNKTTTAADLERGCYSVAKINADPVKVRDDAPNVAGLIPTDNRTELKPYMVEGIGQVHTVTRDAKTSEVGMTLAVFVTPDGRFVALDIDKLPTEGAEFDVEIPKYLVGGKAVRWSMTADAAKPELRPVMFTRRAYGMAHKAAGGRDVYVSGEWQAVIMPVRLQAAS